jgi:hypothetical protein
VERGGTLKLRHTIALLGAITAAAAAPAGAVTVRVEGKTKTLLKTTTVHLHSGWVTKGGAPTGACSAKSAAGALDVATHHRWSGTYYSSFSGYLVDSIFGEHYSASAKYYWAFFDNDVFASAGACAITPHAGDRILFAAVPLKDSADYVVLIKGAPRSARAGHAFKVSVLYVNAKGKKVPLAGARLAGTDFAATATKADGTATITPTKAGKLTLHATHKATQLGTHQYGYVRAASVTVHVTA